MCIYRIIYAFNLQLIGFSHVKTMTRCMQQTVSSLFGKSHTVFEVVHFMTLTSLLLPI